MVGIVSCETCGTQVPVEKPTELRVSIQLFCAEHGHGGDFAVCVRLGSDELTAAEALAVTA